MNKYVTRVFLALDFMGRLMKNNGKLLRILTGVLAVMFTLLFVGCNGGGSGTKPEYKEVAIDATNASVCIGGKVEVKASFNAGAKVQWILSEDDFAEVDSVIYNDEVNATSATCIIKGLAIGSTTLTVTDGRSMKNCEITVVLPSVSLPATAEAVVGTPITLTVTTDSLLSAEWSSSDTAVATVNNGVVTPLKAGETNITVTVSGVSAVCAVTVTVDPSRVTVSLNKNEMTLEEGKSGELFATVSTGAAVTWSSSDNSIATVSNGVVTGIKAGSAVITAAVGEVKATCAVTVNAATEVDGVEIITNGNFATKVDGSDAPAGFVIWGGDGCSIVAACNSEGVALTINNAASNVNYNPQIKQEGLLLQSDKTYALAVTVKSSAVRNAQILIQQDQTWETFLDRTISLTGEFQTFEGTVSVSENKANVLVGIMLGNTGVVASEHVVTIKSISLKECDKAPVVPPKDRLSLAWNDEFDGTALDTSKWNYQTGVYDEYKGNKTGEMFWGNNEQQYYTKDAATVHDGMLEITAKREAMPEGRGFSSARILTRDKASWTFGYFEAKIKMPAINGMWPAFWMLPQPTGSYAENEYGGWAASGELDIMEARGRLDMESITTLHYGGSWPNNTYKSETTALTSPISAWHTYAVDWTADYITWYIDDVAVFTMMNSEWWSSASENPSAPFDKPFYILLNLAVGGNFDSGTMPPDSFTSASMCVDYVRVYQ